MSALLQKSLPLDTRGWLEAQLQRGGDEESLMRAITALCREDSNHAWDILSQLDQFYRRRRISEPVFRAVKRRTEQLALNVRATMHREVRAPVDLPQLLRGRYELMEPLGHGDHGTVYRALDRLRADLPSAEQYVAIKLLRSTDTASSLQLTQLLRECHQAQSLSHPNIVRIYDVDRDHNQAFLVMELLQGMSLQRLLQELPAHKLPVAQALAVIRDVGAAVAYAHSRQMIHGDLQPQNVMIDFDSTLRVLNFGRLSDPADDLHALGCIAYELLAGEHPFGGHLAADAQPLTTRPRRPGGLTRRQWHALRSALAWEHARRPPSVAAWLGQMQLEQAAPRLAPLSVLLQTFAARGARAVRWVLAGVAGLVALTAVGVWGSRPEMRKELANLPAVVPMAATAGTVPTPVTAPRLVVEPTILMAAPVPPNIQLADALILVAEDAAAAQITVHRSGDLHGDINFSWWTEPGTAQPGTDYVADGPQRAQIPDGAESAQLFVPLIKDSTLQGDVEFYVQIGSPAGAALGETTRGMVRILRGQ